jgi:hypothetical protein
MPIRATLTAVAATAAACLLLAPAALASSQSSQQPVQATGKQLKSALLPASDFEADYATKYTFNSGGSLEHRTLNKILSMSCADFWNAIGIVDSFGETAFAINQVDPETGAVPVQEVFSESVYQFAGTHAAVSFYDEMTAKYRSCRVTTESDTKGGTLKDTVHSQSAQRVGGHQAVQLIEYLSDSTVAGPPLVTYVLWTIDGTDAYMISTALLNTKSPQPTQSSLTLKLIARVGALR